MPSQKQIVEKVMHTVSDRGGYRLSAIGFNSEFGDVGLYDIGIRTSLLVLSDYIKEHKNVSFTKAEFKNAKRVGKLCQVVIKKITDEDATDDDVKALIVEVQQ